VELRRKVWIKEEGDRVSECAVDSIIHTLPTEILLFPTSYIPAAGQESLA